MLTATHDAVFVHDDFIRNTERNDFFSYTHTESWKVVANTVRPLEVGIFKRSVFTGGTHIELHIFDVTANSSVDAIF